MVGVSVTVVGVTVRIAVGVTVRITIDGVSLMIGVMVTGWGYGEIYGWGWF